MRYPLALILATAVAGGCDADSVFGPDRDREPSDVDARYEWVEQGWDGTRPVGQASVVVSWTLPEDWDGEVFRVYSRPENRGGYSLAATVTSCGDSFCRYSDLNVLPGEGYDYYVAAVDERENREFASSAVSVVVPTRAVLDAPTDLAARALDGAVWLTWRATGAERYRVFLRLEGTAPVFLELGETDGASFLDTRVTNGTPYGYRVAAIDSLGHVSEQSAQARAVPRPDYQSELIFPASDSLAASGFRFAGSGADSPILSGGSPDAQWRLESAGGALRIVPLGQTAVTAGVFTTTLTCGPASDPDCVSIDSAPASGFGSGPVTVDAGNSYVFRVIGTDGRTHYGKVRVQGRTTTSGGRTVLVFDWAYQLIANEPSLSRSR